MQIKIDTDKQKLIQEDAGQIKELPLYGQEAFQILSGLWLKAGWECKYSYDFQWLGRPIIQLPQDLIRVQELVWETKPDLIIETGVAHGGSSIFFASLMEILGRGRVISVDIEIRQHNREAIEAHPRFKRIKLIERSSTDPETIEEIQAKINPEERVMVFLDSNHTKAHVAQELELYKNFVTPGCYLVAADGVMSILTDVPSGKAEWAKDNPVEAVKEFLEKNPDFEPDESYTRTGLTYFHSGYMKRKS